MSKGRCAAPYPRPQTGPHGGYGLAVETMRGEAKKEKTTKAAIQDMRSCRAGPSTVLKGKIRHLGTGEIPAPSAASRGISEQSREWKPYRRPHCTRERRSAGKTNGSARAHLKPAMARRNVGIAVSSLQPRMLQTLARCKRTARRCTADTDSSRTAEETGE